ncbi:MAG: mechanosensitive ion channel family protein [Anaerolineae bacterium]|jgi:MscS family membrane protein
MTKQRGTRYPGLTLALCIALLLGWGLATVSAQTPESSPSPEATRVLERLQQAVTPTPEGDPQATSAVSEGSATSEGQEGGPEPTETRLLEGVVETRTPVPTATPGRIEREVNRLASRAGLTWTEFLGLSVADWINLGISLAFLLAGYLVGTWLIRSILPRLVRRTETGFDDAFLAQAGSGLRWLVVLVILHFSTNRLVFVNSELKTILADIYFVMGMFLAVRIVWRSVDLADRWYTERAVQTGRADELAPVITLLVRVGRVVVAIIGVTILLSHFGVNVTGFAAALGIGGLAFSLAARDTIADAIAGFIILVDRPFRIGDRIEIQGVGTWGDVTDIGLRTTRIRTRDNRMVIVPNSVIGANQVINYTYPDPRYRIETHVGIGYGTDIETARRVLIEAVQDIEGVLPDRPVDALYIEMGDSAMIFRVRWWIESYVDTRRVLDRVHTALQHALDEAGIESPFPTQSVNLLTGQKADSSLSALPGNSGE